MSYDNVLNHIFSNYPTLDISVKRHKLHSMDPARLIFAGEAMYVRVCKDRAELEREKIPWDTVEQIPVLCGALRELSSKYFDVQFDKPELTALWNQKREEAQSILKYILDYMSFAYRNDPVQLAKVVKIKEGDSAADLIQDLSDISVIGKSKPEPLRMTDFRFQALDEASELASTLGTLAAQAKVAREETPEQKVMRDKVHYLLGNVLKEVSEFGQFTFRGDKAKASKYSIKLPAKRKRKGDQEEGENQR